MTVNKVGGPTEFRWRSQRRPGGTNSGYSTSKIYNVAIRWRFPRRGRMKGQKPKNNRDTPKFRLAVMDLKQICGMSTTAIAKLVSTRKSVITKLLRECGTRPLKGK